MLCTGRPRAGSGIGPNRAGDKPRLHVAADVGAIPRSRPALPMSRAPPPASARSSQRSHCDSTVHRGAQAAYRMVLEALWKGDRGSSPARRRQGQPGVEDGVAGRRPPATAAPAGRDRARAIEAPPERKSPRSRSARAFVAAVTNTRTRLGRRLDERRGPAKASGPPARLKSRDPNGASSRPGRRLSIGAMSRAHLSPSGRPGARGSRERSRRRANGTARSRQGRAAAAAATAPDLPGRRPLPSRLSLRPRRAQGGVRAGRSARFDPEQAARAPRLPHLLPCLLRRQTRGGLTRTRIGARPRAAQARSSPEGPPPSSRGSSTGQVGDGVAFATGYTSRRSRARGQEAGLRLPIYGAPDCSRMIQGPGRGAGAG